MSIADSLEGSVRRRADHQRVMVQCRIDGRLLSRPTQRMTRPSVAAATRAGTIFGTSAEKRPE
jgi:hypothetical protein